MADFSAPSFSLGLDLDEEEEEEAPLPNPRSPEQRQSPTIEEGGGFDTDETLDPDQEEEETLNPGREEEEEEEEEPLPRPVLKRLRRGPPPPPPPAVEEANINLDDDIEEFSSPDPSPLQSRASCSSSKLSLHGLGVLSSQSVNKLRAPKSTPAFNSSSSANFQASTSKNLFPRLTVSPLRKIHLLDSDSDEPSSDKVRVKDTKEADASKKGEQYNQYARGNNLRTSQPHKSQGENLWKYFSPKENVSLATPTLDEFCEEYFTSARSQKVDRHKENDGSLNSSRVLDPDDSVNDVEGCYQQKCLSETPYYNWDFPHPQPPAYKYFYHDDARIRMLVRQRLGFFVPIGDIKGRGTQQFGVENLDYMSQFGPTKGPNQVQGTRKKGSEGNSKTRGKRSRTSVKETSDATEGWLNPPGNTSLPKDAAKRRVSAVGGGSGHWFTGENGRKVYITKDGKELTGRIAYRHYRMESGGGFRKGKKKAAVKRKRK